MKGCHSNQNPKIPSPQQEKRGAHQRMREYRLWRFLFILFFVLVFAYGVVAVKRHGDLKILLHGAQIFQDGTSPYILPMGRGGFEYAPFMLLPFIMLNALPPIAAHWAWHCFLWLCLLFSATALLPVLCKASREKKLARWALLGGLFLISSAVVRELKQGQTDMPLLLLLCGSIYYSVSKRQALPGFFAGAATAMKLYPATTLLYFLFRRESRAILLWMLALLAAFVLPFAIFGPANAYYLTATWWENYIVPSIGGPPPVWESQVRNQSISAFIYRAWGEPSRAPQIISLLVNISLISVSSYVLWCGSRKNKRSIKSELSAFAIVICLFLLSCPLTQKHLYIFLLLPWSLALLHILESTGSRPTRLLFGIALALQLALWAGGGQAVSLLLRSYSVHAWIVLLLWLGLLITVLGKGDNSNIGKDFGCASL